MKFTLIHETKLKVTLTPEDMEALALEYDRMDYHNPDTRAALIAVLDRSKLYVRFNPRGQQLFIEVYPCDEGGCVLYFTCVNVPKRGGIGLAPVVFEFENADDLTEGAAKTHRQYRQRIYRSSLYRLRGKYRLVIYPLDYSDRLSVYFLSEFGEKKGEGEILVAYTEEYGELLIEEDAIDILAENFS